MPSHEATASKNVLIIELNEFTVELLQQAVAQHTLPAIAKILSFPHTQYKTNDRYNSGFLEPWVQWVSVHAGIPATKHQIKHLGDVPDLQFEQGWETLSKHEISTGVWGVMNGARRSATHVPFFLPDPWTFSENAYPEKLNGLLCLPRYVAKNYQNLRFTTLIKNSLKLLGFIATSGVGGKIMSATIDLLKQLRRYGKHHFVYISYFDYISTVLFAKYKTQYQPRCAILFLNSLAHLQHHYWQTGSTVSPQILFGLEYIDKMLALLFTAFPDDAIVVHNGLSQMNTNHEKPWVLYRQKDPKYFMKQLNIPAVKVEQHMTHDGHAFFDTPEICQEIFEKLKAVTLNDKPLFHVERNQHDPCKLFYQLSYTDILEPDPTLHFIYAGKAFRFFEHFDAIVTRTGRHIPIGTIYSNIIRFPDHIYNHQFNQYLFHYLNPEQFPLKQKITTPWVSEPV